MLTLVSFLILLVLCSAEVTILRSVQTVYDRTPKIHILCEGCKPPDGSTEGVIMVVGASSGDLKQGEDYDVTVDAKGLTLNLKSMKKWVDLEGHVPPVQLKLKKFAFASNENLNLLPKDDQDQTITLANILETPSVVENSQTIYQTATNQLNIKGSGFLGAKSVKLYFDPPLKWQIDYEFVTKFPMAEDSELEIRLKHGGKWRSEPGPLVVRGIDTGGGPVQLQGEQGIKVAMVEANMDAHSVSVTNTASQQLIYRDEKEVTVSGSGFNAAGGNKLSFKNGLRGAGKNYTITGASATSLTLTLEKGQLWRMNSVNLPAYLTVLSVDNGLGGGPVSVGPINAGKGQNIATVFERPTVLADTQKQIFRTHTHELTIKGTGFPKTLSRPLLLFDPPLSEGADYTISVVSQQEMLVTLMNQKEWRSTPGKLVLAAINTRGDEHGWVKLDKQVAEVVADVAADETGGVTIIPMGDKVYQSLLSKSIQVIGTGFKAGIKLTLNSALELDTDYKLFLDSPNNIRLELIKGKQWAKESGPLKVLKINVNNQDYHVGGTEGIRIAEVLANPQISSSQDEYHNTQSKLVYIRGSGFTNLKDTKVLIRPTSPSGYTVKSVTSTLIRLELVPESSWGGDADASEQPISVSSIDSGAGAVVLDTPVKIGKILPDKDGVYCDDSCEFSFDDVCDDGSLADGGFYYDDYAYFGNNYYGYGDDYFGNWEDDQSYYYSFNNDFKVGACLLGTDCTDCGGIDYAGTAIKSEKSKDAGDKTVDCSNDCPYARDGVCDDTRGLNFCQLGTDCQDCGPSTAANFTMLDDDGGWWDDDDDYWNFNDSAFMDQTKGIEHQRSKNTEPVGVEEVPTRVYFEVVMLGIAYTVGIVLVSSIVIFAALKAFGYQPGVALRAVCNFGDSNTDIEMATSSRMSIHASTENPMARS